MKELNRIVIRRAEYADAEALLEVASRIYYETFAPVNTPENMDAYMSEAFTLPQLQWELSDARSTFYVAECERKLVAYAKVM